MLGATLKALCFCLSLTFVSSSSKAVDYSVTDIQFELVGYHLYKIRPVLHIAWADTNTTLPLFWKILINNVPVDSGLKSVVSGGTPSCVPLRCPCQNCPEECQCAFESCRICWDDGTFVEGYCQDCYAEVHLCTCGADPKPAGTTYSHTLNLGTPVTVLVDPYDEVPEWDETNNTMTKTFWLPASPAVVVGKVHSVSQGHYQDVSLTLQDATLEMGGFDFLLAYDASALSLTDVTPGDLLDTCDWEYFTYRTGAEGNCGTGCPSGMVRIVALAETNNGANHPVCFGAPDTDPHELATMQFLVTNDRTYSCQYIPIRFYWNDCGDNMISSVAGDTTYIDKAIYNFDSTLVWNEEDSIGFPESTRPQGVGAPDNCLNSNPNKPSPVRYIDFIYGGIDVICAESIDTRGDLNLNNFAYEVADAVMFTNYFIVGLSAFDPYQEAAVAASDVNADGITLSVADLVYLIRVIVGDAQPYPKLAVNRGFEPVIAAWSRSEDGVLSVSGDVRMGAALILAKGEVMPELMATNMLMTYRFDGTHTRILVYPPFADGSHTWETFSGGFIRVKGPVISIDLAAADGRPVTTQTVPTDYVLAQNYPNPFNAATTIRFALPRDGDYTLTIYNAIGQEAARFAGSGKAGNVRIQWNASEQASGVFFYRLDAGGFTQTKKMLLLK